LDVAAVPALVSLRETLATQAWTPESLNQALKDCAKAHGLKLGHIGIPLRLLLFGTAQTPSLDVTLALLGREETLRRLARAWPLLSVTQPPAAG
jgi:glutamyl-tRNA synthetase